MTEAKKKSQKTKQRLILIESKSDEIYETYMKQGRVWFISCITAGAITILLFVIGIIFIAVVGVTQGGIVTLIGTLPAVVSKLFYNGYNTSSKNIEAQRLDLAKQGEEERKRQDQERAEEHKKRKREEDELSIMSKLQVYYKLASENADEDKERYYHELFGLVEYNKRQMEDYFNIMSQMEDENDKRAFFREKFRSLLGAEEAVLTASSQ